MTVTMPERTTPAVRETLDPIRCAPWCTDGSGHPYESSVEGQWCHSIVTRVVTSLYPAQAWSEGGTRPATINMNLGKDVGVRAQVHLELPILGNVHLTPLEAEAVADQLRHMAWVARQTA